MSIRLLFTSAPGLVSGAIRALTGQRASHIGVQVLVRHFDDLVVASPDKLYQAGTNIVLSAESKGVVEHSVASFMGGGRRLVACYEASPATARHMLIWKARAHLGAKYDFKALPGFAWTRLAARWLGKAVRNPTADPKAFVCSEFVLMLDDETGRVPEFAGCDRNTTTPGDILNRLRRGTSFLPLFDLGRDPPVDGDSAAVLG